MQHCLDAVARVCVCVKDESKASAGKKIFMFYEC